MKRANFATILRQSANDILDSLDMRPRPYRGPAMRPGQSVEDAWAATGMYLRRAMDQYGTSSSRERRSR